MIATPPKTPYYIFDIDKLKERTAMIKSKADAAGIGLCYAIKANGFITPYMLQFTEGLEVCSHGELKLCKKQDLPMERIILSGVNKEKEFIMDGIESGVGIITAESALHFEYIKECVKESGKRVDIILRLSNGAQFGMDKKVLVDIIKNRESYDNIHIKGIHYFTGTQKKKAKKIIEELQLCYDLIDELKDRYGYDAELLEYGPGFGVPYFEGDDFDNGMSVYDEVLDWISHNRPACKINFEMGRFFAAPCGTFTTKIADIKENDGLNVCIIDGGKNHISYFGQNMALKTPVIRHIRSDMPIYPDGDDAGKGTKPFTIFGSLCSFHDIIARDVEFTDLSIGDELVFENIGAYSITEGIYLFLSREMPQVWLKENGDLKQARDVVETFEFNG